MFSSERVKTSIKVILIDILCNILMFVSDKLRNKLDEHFNIHRAFHPQLFVQSKVQIRHDLLQIFKSQMLIATQLYFNLHYGIYVASV